MIRLTLVSLRGGKIDDKEYVEHHLDVTRWECLD
jgi:hypothetical protein